MVMCSDATQLRNLLSQEADCEQIGITSKARTVPKLESKRLFVKGGK